MSLTAAAGARQCMQLLVLLLNPDAAVSGLQCPLLLPLP
jgi:hypothetical protein